MTPERMAELSQIKLSGAALRTLLGRESLAAVGRLPGGGRELVEALVALTGLSRTSVYKALVDLDRAGVLDIPRSGIQDSAIRDCGSTQPPANVQSRHDPGLLYNCSTAAAGRHENSDLADDVSDRVKTSDHADAASDRLKTTSLAPSTQTKQTEELNRGVKVSQNRRSPVVPTAHARARSRDCTPNKLPPDYGPGYVDRVLDAHDAIMSELLPGWTRLDRAGDETAIKQALDNHGDVCTVDNWKAVMRVQADSVLVQSALNVDDGPRVEALMTLRTLGHANVFKKRLADAVEVKLRDRRTRKSFVASAPVKNQAELDAREACEKPRVHYELWNTAAMDMRPEITEIKIRQLADHLPENYWTEIVADRLPIDFWEKYGQFIPARFHPR